ncbi:hypothetical protein [Hymenobacter sp. IS2118]|uniref:hypothetical protein n=1 Tax=Hymenobacter sp. IS2118 TaxID=1505605 RepID=UPI00054DB9DA|nr:hypothetical protein [Hymenobacter sp. IS2118]
MLRSFFRSFNLPALLLGGALLLSFGLNVLLLRTQAEAMPDDDHNELAFTTAELHLAQRLLLQCQDQQQRQDSLLARQAATVPVPTPESRAAFTSTQ